MTTTYVQRNFGKFLDDLDGPVVIVKDSQPVKVVVGYQEYLRMKKIEEELLDREFTRLLNKMNKANSKINPQKAEEVIDDAVEAVRSARYQRNS